MEEIIPGCHSGAQIMCHDIDGQIGGGNDGSDITFNLVSRFLTKLGTKFNFFPPSFSSDQEEKMDLYLLAAYDNVLSYRHTPLSRACHAKSLIIDEAMLKDVMRNTFALCLQRDRNAYSPYSTTQSGYAIVKLLNSTQYQLLADIILGTQEKKVQYRDLRTFVLGKNDEAYFKAKKSDVSNAAIESILTDVKPFIVYGPMRYQDELWDILLLILDYHGQLIDFSGADDGLVFNSQLAKWKKCEVNFSAAVKKQMNNLNVSIIDKNELIKYKSELNRKGDLLDLEALIGVNPIIET